MTKQQTVMRVVAGDGEVTVKSQRVARIIAWLVSNQSRVGALPKGQLVFNFAGATGLTGNIVEKFDLNQR